MEYNKLLRKLKEMIKKIEEWFDTSPVHLCLSCDCTLRLKIKSALEKYSLYTEVKMLDESFHGFGICNVEFVGKEVELDNFKLVVEKILFDYLYPYYLRFVKISADTQKIDENIYVVRIYYSFSEKTLKNYEKYFDEIGKHKKQEALEKEFVVDKELEREMDEWGI